MKITMAWRTDVATTARAVRKEGDSSSSVRCVMDGVARGKKIRNRKSLQLVVSFTVCGPSGFHIIHDCEAGPLHPDLRDAEYTCEACEPTDFSAACEIRSTSWEDEYVCKGARSGSRSKQDEIWRQAEGGTAVDDANVLREVGYEDADKDEARRLISGPISATSALFGSYSETAKLVEFGEDKASQWVFITSITQLAGSTQAFVTV